MSNRPNPSHNDALDARRAITAEIRERLRELPPSPFDWSTFDPATALQGNSGAIDLRLVTLGQLLCTAPARSAELRAMWKECVITAAFALQRGAASRRRRDMPAPSPACCIGWETC